MNCKTFRNTMLSADKTSDIQQKEMQLHMQNCKECAELYNDMAMLDTIIESEKSSQPDTRLADRIMNNLLDQSESKVINMWKVSLRKALVAASISLTILVGYKAGSFYTGNEEASSSDQELAYLNDAEMESVNTWIME